MIFEAERFGRVLGLGVDAQLSELTGQLVLRGLPVLPAGIDESQMLWSVFADGERVGVQDGQARRVFLDGAGVFHRRVDVLGVLSDAAGDELAECSLFWAAAVGSQVELRWTDQPAEEDFDAYLIYYVDEVDPVGPVEWVLLAEIEQRDVMSHQVQLGAGGYTFKLLYRDRAGNVGNGETGDLGLTASVVINPPPNAPTISAVALSGRSLVASLAPPEDATGIVGYYWALNQDPQWGELPYAETDAGACVFVPAGGATDLVYPGFAGRWQIGCYAVTQLGAASEVALLGGTLVEDGEGGLLIVEDVEVPPAIVDLRAESVAGAQVALACTAQIDAGGRVEFERSESQAGPFVGVGNGTYETDGTYAWTDEGPLEDGALYWYRARPVNVDVLGNDVAGDVCEPVEALADGTAPSGDQVLTVSVRV